MFLNTPRATSRFLSATLIAVLASAPSKATAPLPPPIKLTEDFGFTCLLLSEQHQPTSLSIAIKYEPMTGKNDFYRTAYWWTLSGDPDRFPSNTTFMNMRSLESAEPTSALHFRAADGWSYSYVLHYSIEERYPSFVYVPDHLIVRRERTQENTGASTSRTKQDRQLVGIGECRLTPARPAQ